jgi:hypothetical protein
VVAILGFVLLPPVSLALAMVQSMGTFYWVYVLPTVIGLSVLPAALLHRWTQGERAVAGLFVLTLLGWFSIRQVIPVWSAATRSGVLWQAPQLLREGVDGNVPIVIADPILFLQLTHYEQPPLGARFRYLTDLEQVLRITGQDSAERSLLDLSRIQPVPLAPYRDFVRANTSFYVYWTGKRWEWLLPKLRHDGARVEVARASGNEVLFLVTFAAGPSGPSTEAADNAAIY